MNSSELALVKRHLSARYTGTSNTLLVTSNASVPKSKELSLDLWKKRVDAVLKGDFQQNSCMGSFPNTRRHTPYVATLGKSVKHEEILDNGGKVLSLNRHYLLFWRRLLDSSSWWVLRKSHNENIIRATEGHESHTLLWSWAFKRWECFFRLCSLVWWD